MKSFSFGSNLNSHVEEASFLILKPASHTKDCVMSTVGEEKNITGAAPGSVEKGIWASLSTATLLLVSYDALRQS